MHLLERVRRCRFCGSDMTDSTSATSYSQNPYCDGCFEERMNRADRQFGPRTWTRVGEYFESIRVNETHSTDGESPEVV